MSAAAETGSPAVAELTSPSQSAPAVQPIGTDSLTCQWAGCGERCTSAEALYDHVCEQHVGRKSTNNLNLTCQWGTCRTTTVKRDHITSHIRVHVPLKPHKCDFCGKSFKRPQDLKKHVKTHAPDDSSLLRSPEPSNAQRPSGMNGFTSANGKLVADLQAMASSANGYYPSSSLNHAGNNNFNQHNLGGNSSLFGGGNQASAYGPVYYPTGAASYDATSVELRRRAVEALNDFLGDAKRRAIDPNSYYDVGSRLMGLQSLPLPVIGGYGGYGNSYGSSGMMDYSSAPQMVSSTAQTTAPQQHYTLPLPNMRTKNDLLNIDQFLEQLQATVYESQQPSTTHYVPPTTSYRSNNSPPHLNFPSTTSTSIAGVNATSDISTPALTPGSSAASYTSGHSPHSSTQGLSPANRNSVGSNMGSMYPNLPSVSADMSAGYTSSAPTSSLGAFDYDNRRRYSGGLLQKAARPSGADDEMDTASDVTPTQSRRASIDDVRGAQARHSPTISSKIDPHLSGDRRSDDGDNAEDRQQEAWVENIRTIERLRAFIKHKLDTREYDDDYENEEQAQHKDEMMRDRDEPLASSASAPVDQLPKSEAESLYPVLRAVEVSE